MLKRYNQLKSVCRIDYHFKLHDVYLSNLNHKLFSTWVNTKTKTMLEFFFQLQFFLSCIVCFFQKVHNVPTKLVPKTSVHI
jgi:hypothetical protein